MRRRKKRGPGGSTFQSRKQEFFSNPDGLGLDQEQKIWAWFVNKQGYDGDRSKMADIASAIQKWLKGNPQKDPEDMGWNVPHGANRLNLLRIMKQFPQGVDPADLSLIQSQFYQTAYSGNGSDIWNVGSGNGVITRKVAAYIYLQDHQNVNVIWPASTTSQGNFNYATSFSYGGRTYQQGQSYNGFEMMRDWIYATFDWWVNSGEWTGEFDAFYTPPFIYAVYTLYDFAQDATMKRKAKMMVDKMLLDAILNVSSNNTGEAIHGGVYGRTYGNQALQKSEPCIYWYPFWGLTRGGSKYRWHSSHAIYVSDFGNNDFSGSIIEDIGNLSNEPLHYYHINTEYHGGAGVRGKWTYVTKHYNLGSVVSGGNNRWILNVISRDPNNRYDAGISMWIDHYPQIPGPSGEYYLEYGEAGYQYKNAILVFGDQGPNYLHFAEPNRNDTAGNTFNVDENDGGWRFLRKDDAGASVALAVKMGTSAQAIEACLVGADYPTYEAFKAAVKSKASLQDSQYGSFTTSKGLRISRDYDQAAQRYYMTVNGRRVFPDGTPDDNQSAARLDCVDYEGDKIVDWNWPNKIMTLYKYGKPLTYDFKDWVTDTMGALATGSASKVAIPPKISPNGGVFGNTTTVTITSRTSGATIRYTTDGSTPTASSTLYAGPFKVSSTAMVRARAFKGNMADSNVASADVIIDTVGVPAPEITPNGGTHEGSVEITLSNSMSGVTIRYTTDGSDPTSSSTQYAGPFNLTSNATVKARAYKSGLKDSPVAEAGFTINKTTEYVLVDDKQANFLGGGWEEMNYIDNSYNGKAHRHWNNENASVMWQPQLEKSGEYDVLVWWGDGDGGLGIKVPYTIHYAGGDTTIYMNQNGAPGTWHSLGRYNFNSGNAGYVKMTDASGTTGKHVVADAVKFELLKESSGGGALPPVATPVISPNGGSFNNSATVTLSTATSGATIHYTTDGSDPTASSPVYSGPLNLKQSATVKACAMKTGMSASDVANAKFTIGGVGVPPAVIVIVDDSDPQVLFNGSGWQEMDFVSDSHGGKSRRHWNNEGESAVWQPQLPQAGVYEVSAWWGDGDGGLGIKVPYTINHAGGAATVYMNQNTAPATWHSLGKYTFNAGNAGSVKLLDSSGSTDKFVVADALKFELMGSAPPKVATPTISPNGGTFSSALTVTLTISTPGAAIHYTMDGSDPTASSALYSAPLQVTKSATVKARAFAAGMTDSDVITAAFTFSSGTQPVEIVLDDTSQQVTFLGDGWEQMNFVGVSHGLTAHRHWNNEGASVRWQPVIFQTGSYEVFAWWGDGDNGLGTRVPYTINHAGGTKTVYMNQNAAPETWHALGIYTFNAGTSGAVEMTDESGANDRFVVADAIKFVLASGTRGRRRGGKRRGKPAKAKPAKGKRGGKVVRAKKSGKAAAPKKISKTKSSSRKTTKARLNKRGGKK